MNRFFRTAFSTTLVYLCLTLFGVLIARARMPFLAFFCLYLGLLLSLLPGVSGRLAGKERLCMAIGAVTAMLGFLPLALWHSPTLYWLIHLLGIGAAAVFRSSLRHRTTHSDFMAKYEFTAVALLILIGFVCLATLTGIYRDGESSARGEAVSLAVSGIVPYAVVLLGSGVMLLRGLRAQPGMVDEQAFRRRQLRDALIFAAVVALVFAADPFVYLAKASSFLLDDVLRPLARALGRLLLALLRSTPLPDRRAEETLPPMETVDPQQLPMLEPAEEAVEHYYFEGDDLTLTIAYIFIAATALVLLYILARQIRKLVLELRGHSNDRGSGYPNETREALPPQEESGRKGRPKRRSGDPRERIRYLYGAFLRCLGKRRVRVGRTDTCGEIRRRAEKRSVADPPTLSELTRIYESARYRMEETPSGADAQAMEELLDRIRKRP
ncbi:MAG: DUF4129 domain-containing protein [Oscillospiraceae bacterium]|nr:DUF4129 domain-containing protein [Oscillospiraceae bacterium]